MITFANSEDPDQMQHNAAYTVCKGRQKMSQSRDECPQRNWSSIRHIRGKLAVI